MTVTEEKIIFPEDVTPKRVTISQWDDGEKLEKPIVLFYNHERECLSPDEALVRDSIATHYSCECGCPSKKPFLRCENCRAKADLEKWEKTPKKEWDEKIPICDNEGNFFSEWNDVFDYCIQHEDQITPKNLELFLTKKEKFRGRISFYDLFNDILPEGFDDSDIPMSIQYAIDDCNRVIDSMDITASYRPTEIAVLVTDEVMKDFEEYKQEQEKIMNPV